MHNIFFGKILVKKNFFFLNKFDVFILNILFALIFILGVLPSFFLFNLEQEIFVLLSSNYISL
jgi:NADH:ubiquinone oxidoreductase subunit 4 (subunit M)